MKKGKKFLFLSAVTALLAVWLVFGVSAGYGGMPAGPDAPQYADNDFYYDIVDDEVIIAGYYGENTELSFPEYLNGYPVTKIQMISDSYTPNCENILSIHIGTHIKAIIPWNYDNVFYMFENLEKITVAENNMYYSDSEGVLYNKELTDLILYPFACKKTEYIMPDTVKSVSCEFCCPHLVSVTLSDNLTTVDTFIFSGCNALEKINIGKGTQELENFSNCWTINEISVDSENKYFCTDENGVLFNKDKTKLIQYPSAKEQTAYNIPDSVKEIGNDAFEGAENLLKVSIPNGVELIGSRSFFNCENLTEITIPDSVKEIGDSAFDNCSDLRRVSLGKNIEAIGRYAFYKCWIEEITIPDSVKEIGDNAFDNCSVLRKIYLPDSVELIGNYAFEDTAYYKDSSNWDNGNLYIGKHLIKANSAMEIIPGTKTIAGGAFSYRDDIINIIVPDGVVGIGKNAFAGCTNLKSIKIPESVRILDVGVFSGCRSLVKVKLPDGITKISQSLFDYCQGLEYVNIPKSVKQIEAFAFSFCEKLKEIYIPEGVEFVGFDSFYGCTGLTSIILPESLKEIDFYAFESCENLDSVTLYNPECKLDDGQTLPELTVIIGFAGSTAEEYAKKYNRKFVPFQAITDADTGIKVDYTETTFKNAVPEIMITEDGENADSIFGDTFDKFISYDISFVCGGEKIQPDEAVTVKIPLPADYSAEFCAVYHIDENGKEAKLKSRCESGYIIFETDHFSEYVLVDENSMITDEPETEPDTPETEPAEPNNPSTACSCNCHKSGFMGFIWKILRVFYKLFKINTVCACGELHY